MKRMKVGLWRLQVSDPMESIGLTNPDSQRRLSELKARMGSERRRVKDTDVPVMKHTDDTLILMHANKNIRSTLGLMEDASCCHLFHLPLLNISCSLPGPVCQLWAAVACSIHLSLSAFGENFLNSLERKWLKLWILLMETSSRADLNMIKDKTHYVAGKHILLPL